MPKGIVAERTTEAMRVSQFWMQVDRREPDGCWLWTGYVEDGYGRAYDGTRMVGAHELALTYTTGEVRLPELDTCHSCNNPLCCNPSHLRFDTRQSNVDDCVRSNRHAFGRRNGHARLTEDDVRVIRERNAAGATLLRLAEQYGVNSTTVHAIVTGRNWKHVGGPIRASHGKHKEATHV